MIPLRTARVVVIDDEPAEALPVMRALGRLGIGSVHIAGDRLEDLPVRPLTGIRLVFLDMKLGTGGGERVTAPHTANVFRNVVASGSGPTLVVLWTKHPEEVETFRQALFREVPEFRAGLLFANLEKPATEADYDVERIADGIKQIIARFAPADMVWVWEQLTHDAATSTVAAISAIVSQRAGLESTDDDNVRAEKWLSSLQHILGACARAAAGQVEADAPVFGHLTEVLNAIHEDRLEHEAAATFAAGSPAPISTEMPTDNERAAINAMLLTALARPGDTLPRPGNLYEPEGSGSPHALCGVDAVAVAAEIFRSDKDASVKELKQQIQQARTRKASGDDLQALERALAARHVEVVSVWLKQCRSVLLELSPACDFAQGKRPVSRLLAGLAVPPDLTENLVAKADYIRRIGPLHLPNSQAAWLMVFDCHFGFSISKPDETIRAAALCRFRNQVLVDIQAWYSAQSARPGYLCL